MTGERIAPDCVGCRKSGDLLEREGYAVQRVTDAQTLVIDGDEQRIV